MSYLEEGKKREEWVSTLKVGDKIAVYSGSLGWRSWYIHEVLKITPSGRLNLSGGLVANTDGSLRGHSFTHIHPVTEEVEKSIWRMKALQKARHLDVGKLSDKHLNQLIKIMREHEEEQDDSK